MGADAPPEVNRNMMNLFRRHSRLPALAALCLLLAAAFACDASNPQSTFDARGYVAQTQLNLFWLILGAGAVVFVFVQGAIIYMIIKFRRRRADRLPEQVEGNATVEFAWTAGPTVLLILVAIPTVLTTFDNQVSPDQGALTVDVVGHQWWFEFRYPHPDDPEKEVRFANDLHMPVDEVVNVNLLSEDVIHSFWIPKIAGKVDMIPGGDNTMWIQANETGMYYGQCLEFCGVQHANMRFRVYVHEREDFDAWLRAEAQPAVDSPDPLAQAGKNVFLTAGCTACHQTQSVVPVGQVSLQGPSLAHVASRSIFAGGVFDNRDESGRVNDAIVQRNLRTWLEDPEAAKTGNVMAREAPNYMNPEDALTEAELSALVAYLSTLK